MLTCACADLCLGHRLAASLAEALSLSYNHSARAQHHLLPSRHNQCAVHHLKSRLAPRQKSGANPTARYCEGLHTLGGIDKLHCTATVYTRNLKASTQAPPVVKCCLYTTNAPTQYTAATLHAAGKTAAAHTPVHKPTPCNRCCLGATFQKGTRKHTRDAACRQQKSRKKAESVLVQDTLEGAQRGQLANGVGAANDTQQLHC